MIVTDNTILKYTVKRSKRAKGNVVIIDTLRALKSIMKLGELNAREVQLLLRFGKLERHNKEYHTIERYHKEAKLETHTRSMANQEY